MKKIKCMHYVRSNSVALIFVGHFMNYSYQQNDTTRVDQFVTENSVTIKT